MPNKVLYHKDRDYIEIISTGTFNRKHIDQSGSELIRVSTETDCHKFLHDMRNIELDLSTVEIYKNPERLLVQGYLRGDKRAVVFNSYSEEFQFYENTARNQGFNVRIFKDYDEAKTWLLS